MPGENEPVFDELELLKSRWEYLSLRLHLTCRQLRNTVLQTLALIEQRMACARSLHRAQLQLRHTVAEGVAIREVFSGKKPN